ncbi:hypothetical protein [Thermomonospora catenispora]|uniref:hypothetical protein n=1 Tax=Thermomonospora catenispora TaxID=2493090 RepID=UPI0011203D56|nr:hypothetical protein [Thermomonospora catenispora]TNY38252.1 hypothetical protein EIO00_04385 [Thermomonospora catenispora]
MQTIAAPGRQTVTAPPPAWPVPAEQAERARIIAERSRELSELCRLYPGAAPWCANDGSWYAAPADDNTLLRASSAAELAAMLADHYRHQHQATRPRRPSGAPRPGGYGAAARPVPRTVRAAARSTRTPTRYDRVRQWLGR